MQIAPFATKRQEKRVLIRLEWYRAEALFRDFLTPFKIFVAKLL